MNLLDKTNFVQADAYRLPYPDETFQTVVTSPPYYGLRDYGTADWVGGDSECDHIPEIVQGSTSDRKGRTFIHYYPFKETCGKCGAIRKDKQIGTEDSMFDYIDNILLICEEIRRVLRPTGTFWLNIGDSYNSNPSNQQNGSIDRPYYESAVRSMGRKKRNSGINLRRKNLMLIPFRLAIGLQDQGWIVRNDNIWFKTNPTPESVNDRSTRSHEYIFLLTKEEIYFYDNDSIREPLAEATIPRALRAVSGENKNWKDGGRSTSKAMSIPRENRRKAFLREMGGGGSGFNGHSGYYDSDGRLLVNPLGRNRRSVWEITLKPYKGSHFATFPPELPEICIKAGTSDRGECPECGSPWERISIKETIFESGSGKAGRTPEEVGGKWGDDRHGNNLLLGPTVKKITAGFRPTCDHYDDRYRSEFQRTQNRRKRNHQDLSGSWFDRVRKRPGRSDWETVPQKVLDPFSGSGTTVMVARNLGRIGVGSELNFDYILQSKERTGSNDLEDWINGKKIGENDFEGLPMFEGIENV